MAGTPIYGLRYPEKTDTPDVRRDLRNLAEDTEDELDRIDGSVGAVGTDLADLQAAVTAIQNTPIPGTRIATEVVTTGSSTFTSQTSLVTVDAPLVAGRTYRIRVTTSIASSVSGDVSGTRIRLDNVAGSQLQFRQQTIETSNNLGVHHTIEVEYEAPSTGTQTFAFTVERRSGSGSLTMEAASNRITYMTVDYIYG